MTNTKQLPTARSINHRVNEDQLRRVIEAKMFISEPYRMHVIETQWLNHKATTVEAPKEEETEILCN